MRGDAVVYVHGLWFGGQEAFALRRRFEADYGYRFHVFRYSSLHDSLADIVAALQQYVSALGAARIHLLGHSLGGLIILRCLERYTLPVPGRVVFFGTPANASRTARSLGRFRLGRALLGPAIVEELLMARERVWSAERELGLIGGTKPFGFGRLLVHFDEANDGTVALSETRLRGADAHLTLPVTHTGMLWSARVTREIWNFLEYGRFTA